LDAPSFDEDGGSSRDKSSTGAHLCGIGPRSGICNMEEAFFEARRLKALHISGAINHAKLPRR
jgi:hypothetical protein